ncbi:carboxypeptidase regulatory-like domain-containing protein [Pedobacter sp. UC225_65]|uniref:carboxypeptidase regulatory-like domain-containing protein n=1 Tax=Pedobacter sp. UC225_65 TaxID=3350173 RepID=UPI00366D6162
MKIQLHLKFILLFMLFARFAQAQQHASIKGKITTVDGQPAAYVNIGLKDKNQGTTTNDKGEYNLPRVKPGTYTLTASAVGSIHKKKTLRL